MGQMCAKRLVLCVPEGMPHVCRRVPVCTDVGQGLSLRVPTCTERVGQRVPRRVIARKAHVWQAPLSKMCKRTPSRNQDPYPLPAPGLVHDSTPFMSIQRIGKRVNSKGHTGRLRQTEVSSPTKLAGATVLTEHGSREYRFGSRHSWMPTTSVVVI